MNLKDGFVKIQGAEVYLEKIHINEYKMANIQNHDPLRSRKLLLKRSEINKLYTKTSERGLTIVPTKIYFKGGRAKIEIALAKGKKIYDKRETIKKKDVGREMDRALKGKRKKKGSLKD